MSVHHERGRPRPWIRALARRSRRGAIVALVLVASVLGVSGSVVLFGGSGGPWHALNLRARERGAAGVAAVDGHPLRCLTVTFAMDDAAYARADFNRAVACGRYAGYATAIFHRTDGIWRPVLDSLHYSCPVADIPRAIQAELVVCP